MHVYFDGWYDIWRIVVFLVCLICMVVLGNRFRRNSKDWNAKTKDYWWSLMCWSTAGVVVAFQGFVQHVGLTPVLLFVTLAALVSLNGLRRSGAWGGDG